MTAKVKADSPRPLASVPLDNSLFSKLVRLVNLTARPLSQTIGKANWL